MRGEVSPNFAFWQKLSKRSKFSTILFELEG